MNLKQQFINKVTVYMQNADKCTEDMYHIYGTLVHIYHYICICTIYISRIYLFFLLPKSVSPEDSEKKRNNYQAYRSFLNREGPKALGSKEIPQVSLATAEFLRVAVVYIVDFPPVLKSDLASIN